MLVFRKNLRTNKMNDPFLLFYFQYLLERHIKDPDNCDGDFFSKVSSIVDVWQCHDYLSVLSNNLMSLFSL